MMIYDDDGTGDEYRVLTVSDIYHIPLFIEPTLLWSLQGVLWVNMAWLNTKVVLKKYEVVSKSETEKNEFKL